MTNQRTIARSFAIDGIGIHTGTWSAVTVKPAPCNSGIRFSCARTGRTIPAVIEHVMAHQFRTSLSHGGFSISTIEHLMAALRVFEINNALIEVLGDEIPILDGSAREWVNAITACGVEIQQEMSRRIRITGEIRVGNSNVWCMLRPYLNGDGFSMSYDLAYDHPKIGSQFVSTELALETFMQDLADARTFGFVDDLPRMRKLGLAQGASIYNTVVFSSSGLVNPEGLRWHNEPARHKLVDALGDLFLLGHSVIGHFHGHLSGHNHNQQLVRAVLNSPESWCFE